MGNKIGALMGLGALAAASGCNPAPTCLDGVDGLGFAVELHAGNHATSPEKVNTLCSTTKNAAMVCVVHNDNVSCTNPGENLACPKADVASGACDSPEILQAISDPSLTGVDCVIGEEAEKLKEAMAFLLENDRVCTSNN